MSTEGPGQPFSGNKPGQPFPESMGDLAAALEELRKRVDLLSADHSAQANLMSVAHESTVFAVMPFGHEDLQVVYEDYVKPTIEKYCSLNCVRGDDIFGSGVVMDDVLHAIAAAEIVLADLTGQNANVFYEVGIAHATQKSVLLMAQSLDDVPFDLRHRRVLIYDYSPRGCKRLEQRLTDHILDMRKHLT